MEPSKRETHSPTESSIEHWRCTASIAYARWASCIRSEGVSEPTGVRTQIEDKDTLDICDMVTCPSSRALQMPTLLGPIPPAHGII